MDYSTELTFYKKTASDFRPGCRLAGRFCILSCLLLCLFQPLCAQKNGQELIDSLLGELSLQKQDTAVINLQNAISLQNTFLGNFDTAIYYVNCAMKLAEKKHYKKGIADACYNTGNIFDSKGNRTAALEKYFQSLKIQQEIGNTVGIIDAYMNIGSNYHSIGNETEAITYELIALKIAEKINDRYRIASCYINISLIYNSQGNYEEAEKNALASLKMAAQIGNKYVQVTNYINLGLIYYYLNRYPQALQSYDSALNISLLLKNKIDVAYSYNGIALIKEMMKDYPEALRNNYAAMKIQEETADKYGMSISCQNLGSVYTKSNNPAEGRKWALKALALSKELGDKVNIRDIYQILLWADSSLGNFKAAFEDHKMYSLYKDSLFNEENTRKITQSVMQYEFDKKQLSDSLKNKEIKELAAIQLKRQKTFTYASVIVGILLLALSILIYFYYKQVATQKQKTERLRLSRDLHDDIGSTLSSMGMYSKIAIDKLQEQNSKEAFEVLDKMNSLSRRMSDQMNDLVWNINPDNDSMQQTADRMKLIAAKALEPLDINYRFNTHGINENIFLSIEQRKNLLLLFKEAINNITKYAACKNVNVDLSFRNGLVMLNISDDGIGFDVNGDVSENTGGNGLRNMKTRITQLGGSFSISSETGKGTVINCSFAA